MWCWIPLWSHTLMWLLSYYTWNHKLIIRYFFPSQHPKKLPQSKTVSLNVLLWLFWDHTASEPVTTALTHNFYYTYYSQPPKHPPPSRLGAVIKSNGSQLGLDVIGQECRLGREATGLFHTTSAGGRSGRGGLAQTGTRRASAGEPCSLWTVLIRSVTETTWEKHLAGHPVPRVPRK